MVAVVACVCALLGVLVGLLLARVKLSGSISDLQAELLVAKNQAESLADRERLAKEDASRQIAEIKSEAEGRLTLAKADAENRLAELKKEAEERVAKIKSENAQQLVQAKAEWQELHQKSLEEQRAHFDEISAKLVAEAKNATEAMVKQRQKEIADAGDATIEKFVSPLKETIEKMERTMNDTTLKQTENNTSLKEALQQAMKSNEDTKRTADELVRAFRHDSKVQGDWGEQVLEELLESLGLQKGVHFDVQETLRDASGRVIVAEESGSRMRPDVIVHLDSKKEVIVDSKVSTAAFLSYASEEDPEKRARFLKDHINSLKAHVKELSKKNYSSYVKAPKETMDFVIMFVPRSAALWTALAEEPALWREAMDMNVFIADEQTLYAALRMVKLTWCQIQQAENHQKVYELANEMLNRVGQFVKHMESIGKSLDDAQKAYGKGMAKLSERGQSIVTTCRQLESLGAKQNSKNPISPTLDDVGLIATDDEAAG